MRKPKQEGLRIAVVGLGHFAQVAVLPALRTVKSVRIAGLVSGSPEKLSTLGDRYAVPARVNYAGYDDLLASGDIDAVYIALPNDLHAEYAIRAARRGVHVLCEKPMAVTEDECAEMIQVCEQHHAKLMIGYRLHFEAANLAVVDAIRAGDIGEPRFFSSVFAMQVRGGNIRTQPRPGAGPLYDIGIYCINAARYLLQAEPIEVAAIQLDNRVDDRFAHVPEALSVSLRFKGGEVATFTCSFGAQSRAHYEVVGTEGRIELDNCYEYTEPMRMRVVRGSQEKTRTFRKKDQIAAEVDYFARCIRDDVSPEPSGYEGLADVRIIQAIQKAVVTGRAVDLLLPEREQRPTGAQAITYPPHGKPRLVGVQSASQ
jgi:predicted dehydrogenase